MAVAYPAGFGQFAWVFSGPYGTAPYIFTIGVDLTAGVTAPSGLADIAFDAFGGDMLDELSQGLSLDKVTLTIGQGGGIQGSYDSTRTPNNGNRDGDNDPIALAFLVNKVTNTPGRRGRGRMFIPGVLKGNDTGLGGDLTPSAQSRLGASLNDFIATLNTDLAAVDPSYALVLLHDDESLDPSPIVAFRQASKVGVLRKRLR